MMLSSFFIGLISVLSRCWAPILLGIVINIVVEIFMPKKTILSNFEKKDFLTLLRASVAGFIISGLSFGVVPTIVSLRKNGASAPAVAAMLAFTPWSGSLGLMIIGSYVGFLTLLKLLGYSFLLSIILGVAFSVLDKIKLLKPRTIIENDYLKQENYQGFSSYLAKRMGIKEIKSSSIGILKNVAVAVLFTALFELIFSASFILKHFSSIYSILYAIPLATLAELIGEGFSVFAGELYLFGASLGVVFSIMVSGVITDINELSMLAKIFSKRAATFYLVISLILIVSFAYMLI